MDFDTLLFAAERGITVALSALSDQKTQLPAIVPISIIVINNLALILLGRFVERRREKVRQRVYQQHASLGLITLPPDRRLPGEHPGERIYFPPGWLPDGATPEQRATAAAELATAGAPLLRTRDLAERLLIAIPIGYLFFLLVTRFLFPLTPLLFSLLLLALIAISFLLVSSRFGYTDRLSSGVLRIRLRTLAAGQLLAFVTVALFQPAFYSAGVGVDAFYMVTVMCLTVVGLSRLLRRFKAS